MLNTTRPRLIHLHPSQVLQTSVSILDLLSLSANRSEILRSDVEGVRPNQVSNLIQEALFWGCFFGVEVIFLLTERIDQSKWTKRSAWEDRDIKGGHRPNCGALPSLTSWTRKKKKKMTKNTETKKNSYLGQRGRIRSSRGGAAASCEGGSVCTCTRRAQKFHLLRERSQVRKRVTLV